jgi:hypothetical protein
MFAAQKIGGRKLYWLLLIALSLALSVAGQGTFIYDQQSADETAGGGAGVGIQAYQPTGQSFTPAITTVGFIRLQLADANYGNGSGATVYVNLRSNSITGPIMGSTDPVFMPDGFGIGNGNRGYTNFFFSTAVSVIPGTTYYFQPVVQSGNDLVIIGYNYGYSGGTAFFQGVANPNSDLWFREGIYVVPEPSSLSLVIGHDHSLK